MNTKTPLQNKNNNNLFSIGGEESNGHSSKLNFENYIYI